MYEPNTALLDTRTAAGVTALLHQHSDWVERPTNNASAKQPAAAAQLCSFAQTSTSDHVVYMYLRLISSRSSLMAVIFQGVVAASLAPIRCAAAACIESYARSVPSSTAYNRAGVLHR